MAAETRTTAIAVEKFRSTDATTKQLAVFLGEIDSLAWGAELKYRFDQVNDIHRRGQKKPRAKKKNVHEFVQKDLGGQKVPSPGGGVFVPSNERAALLLAIAWLANPSRVAVDTAARADFVEPNRTAIALTVAAAVRDLLRAGDLPERDARVDALAHAPTRADDVPTGALRQVALPVVGLGLFRTDRPAPPWLPTIRKQLWERYKRTSKKGSSTSEFDTSYRESIGASNVKGGGTQTFLPAPGTIGNAFHNPPRPRPQRERLAAVFIDFRFQTIDFQTIDTRTDDDIPGDAVRFIHDYPYIPLPESADADPLITRADALLWIDSLVTALQERSFRGAAATADEARRLLAGTAAATTKTSPAEHDLLRSQVVGELLADADIVDRAIDILGHGGDDGTVTEALERLRTLRAAAPFEGASDGVIALITGAIVAALPTDHSEEDS